MTRMTIAEAITDAIGMAMDKDDDGKVSKDEFVGTYRHNKRGFGFVVPQAGAGTELLVFSAVLLGGTPAIAGETLVPKSVLVY